MEYKLIYVNNLNYDYKGNGKYEFIFCDETSELEDVWGEGWEAIPASYSVQPPDEEYIAKVGTLSVKHYELDVVQDHFFHGMCDAKDDVIALAWEKIDEEFSPNLKRLVFRFGETLEEVEAKLSKRKMKLIYEEEE
jgi:hypothetical protein